MAEDYVLARVYKHCTYIFDLDTLIGNNAIENEFHKFKDAFDSRTRTGDVRSSFKSLVMQIFQHRDGILATETTQDKFEETGFSYNEDTFDQIFSKKFHEVLNVSTDSSDDAKEYADLDDDNQIDSFKINNKSHNDGSGKDSFFDSDSKTLSPKQIKE